MKYLVTFTTQEVVEAENEEAALEIAEDMDIMFNEFDIGIEPTD